jgi:capsular polysaccharide biosynthesis protein
LLELTNARSTAPEQRRVCEARAPQFGRRVQRGRDMSISAIVAMLVRRWYFLLIAVLLSVGMAIGGFAMTKATYEARADLLLLPSPRTSGDNGGPGNPYLALNDSLGQAAQIVAAQVTSDQTAARIGQQGRTAVYTVGIDTSFSAPVVLVTARDASAGNASATLKTVMSEFNRTLAAVQQQAGAPARALVGTTVITTTPTPQRLLKTPIRNAIGGAVLGMLLGLLPVLLLERLAGSRSRRRRSRVRAARPARSVAESMVAGRRRRAGATTPVVAIADEVEVRGGIMRRRRAVRLRREATAASRDREVHDGGRHSRDGQTGPEAAHADVPISLLLADQRDT